MAPLVTVERLADGQPTGLLVLHHGRGTDENDLLPIAGVLDPDRRLQVVAPRAPLTLPGWPGHHWYTVPRVGYPDPATFADAYRGLADLHDELWKRTGLSPAETILAGFSMGSVMSYALGLGGDRPTPAGILAFSGFVPTVEGWTADLTGREQLRVFAAHGRRDAVIDVGFARSAHELLAGAGIAVEYHESEVAHQIDPVHLGLARTWLERTLTLAHTPRLVPEPAAPDKAHDEGHAQPPDEAPEAEATGFP